MKVRTGAIYIDRKFNNHWVKPYDATDDCFIWVTDWDLRNGGNWVVSTERGRDLYHPQTWYYRSDFDRMFRLATEAEIKAFRLMVTL